MIISIVAPKIRVYTILQKKFTIFMIWAIMIKDVGKRRRPLWTTMIRNICGSR